MSDPQDAAGATVLVVDDDQRNVRLIESILKGSGYRVLKAYNGEEALQVVEAEHPDLLVLDVMMPRVSGFELCQQLKGRYETRLLPVIMVTALNALEDKVQALEYGADDFLTKPINKLELLAKVRSVLRVKALQDEVEAANHQLVRMQGFKESMMQMVVHDLKNPLASIMGNIQLIQMQSLETMTPTRLAELLQRTQESARQLMRMILNILQIGKLEEQKMPLRLEPVVLHALVQENADEMMGLSARDGIRLENRVRTDLPAPCADRELVSRVIANLLSNAFKHTPSGGRVVVDARTEGDQITLTISDTGEGIPEELQPRIFDKWVGDSESSKRLLNDSGLGLTFCRLAVECHGGRIWLKSKAREGTTVFVSLPIAGPQTGSAPAASGASAA
ncbi:MAG TPA: hybrid sensor histidine kinase/response regulator [Candidatus Binatia bacterium]|nr:hybrid sensor histidine kinase/response regulator [Candidatus Binatia bacterium]